MSLKSKMTAIADEIRTLSDTESVLDLDTMASKLSDTNDEVDIQTSLISQIQSVVSGKAAGSGTNEVELSLLTREITEYSNPTLTYIGPYAFSGTSIASLNLPSLTTIGGYAFYECTTLANVTFQSLTEVPYNGLRQYKGLVKADFYVLKKIGQNGFYQCTNFETLIIRTNSVCTLVAGTIFNGSKIFSGTGYIYVPSSLVDSYKTATNWSTYANQFRAIEDYPDICG